MNWISYVTTANIEKVKTYIDAYLGSNDVKSGVCMRLGKLLLQGHRDGWQGKWPTTIATVRPKAEEDIWKTA